MKLKDDEKRVLMILAGHDQTTPKNDRYQSILNKFKAHGLIDEGRKLTRIGIHVLCKVSSELHPPKKKASKRGRRKTDQDSDVSGQKKPKVDASTRPDLD
jgi:hypothetical protein